MEGMHNVQVFFFLLKKKLQIYLHERSLPESLQTLSDGNFWVWNLRWLIFLFLFCLSSNVISSEIIDHVKVKIKEEGKKSV